MMEMSEFHSAEQDQDPQEMMMSSLLAELNGGAGGANGNGTRFRRQAPPDRMQCKGKHKIFYFVYDVESKNR